MGVTLQPRVQCKNQHLHWLSLNELPQVWMNYFILGFSWICHHVKNILIYVIPSIANCHHLKNPKKFFNEDIYIVTGVIQCSESKYVWGIFIACSVFYTFVQVNCLKD